MRQLLRGCERSVAEVQASFVPAALQAAEKVVLEERKADSSPTKAVWNDKKKGLGGTTEGVTLPENPIPGGAPEGVP